MKQSAFVVALLAMLLLADIVPAADNSLKILAARQELEEFIRRTNTRLRDLEEAQNAQQRLISKLENENRKLRSELAKAGNDNRTTSMESNLKQLAKHIEKVDKQRAEDFKVTQDEFKRLANLIGKSTRISSPPPPKPVVIDPNAEVFKYKIQQGDYLFNIVSKLKKQGVYVTVDQIKKANPKVVWTKLQIDQEILIPVVNE